jgi:hypothetical protein|tara:strand:+ start:1917 stop:2453 length:537 start_codon:yes stop_codon:yes gene_type:complete
MKDLIVPPELRGILKMPFGELYAGSGLIPANKVKSLLKGEKLIIVGDITLKNMLAVGIKPNLSIVDLKSKRDQMIETKLSGIILNALNPPGRITIDLWDKIHAALDGNNTTIIVDGEEDLAVIPCIIEADWNTVILYGQPDEGIVYIHVDEETKFETAMILKVLLSNATEFGGNFDEN